MNNKWDRLLMGGPFFICHFLPILFNNVSQKIIEEKYGVKNGFCCSVFFRKRLQVSKKNYNFAADYVLVSCDYIL